MLSGNSSLLHFPIGPDRVLFGAGLILLALDPVAWRPVQLRVGAVHVFFTVLILDIVFSASLHGTLTTTNGFYALLDRVVVPFIYLLIGPVVFNTPKRRQLLLQALVGLGLYLGVTAFFEVVGPQALVLPRFIQDSSIGAGFGQARGPFTSPEADGLTMCACALAATYGVVRWRGRWRLAAAFAVGADLFGVFLTLTRSVWIGTSVAFITASLVEPRLRRFLPRLAAGAAAIIVIALLADPSLRSFASHRAGTSRSVYDRRNTDAAALRVLEQHPLTGVGWTRFIDVSPDYVRQASAYPITTITIEVHNVLLSRAAELGIPAALVFLCALLTGPARGALRRPSEALREWRLMLLAYTLCWGTVSLLSPLPYPLPNALLWLFTGITLSPVISAPTPSRLLGVVPSRRIRNKPDRRSRAPRRPSAHLVRRPQPYPVRFARRPAPPR